MIFVPLEVLDTSTYKKKREGEIWKEKKLGKKANGRPHAFVSVSRVFGVLKSSYLLGKKSCMSCRIESNDAHSFNFI